MNYLCMQIVRLTVLICLFAQFLSATDKIEYITLENLSDDVPSGQVILEVAPKGWDKDWFVSAFTPSGYRIFIKMISDRASAESGKKLILEIPSGTYKFEITQRPEILILGAKGEFKDSDGRWSFPDISGDLVTEFEVTIRADEVTRIEIDCQNPSTVKKTGYDEKEKSLDICDTVIINQKPVSKESIPNKGPDEFGLCKSKSFNKLEEGDFINALKMGYMVSLVALDALQKAETVNVAPLISELEEDISIFNGRIARLFAYHKITDAVDILTNILSKGDINSRYLAAWSLGEIGNKTAVPSLIDAMRDESELVRLHVAFALGQIGDSTALPSLKEAVNDKSCYEGNYFALSETEMYAAQYYTKDGLQEDVVPVPFYCVSQNAIYAISQIKSQRATDFLNDLMENSGDEKIRETLIDISWGN